MTLPPNWKWHVENYAMSLRKPFDSFPRGPVTQDGIPLMEIREVEFRELLFNKLPSTIILAPSHDDPNAADFVTNGRPLGDGFAASMTIRADPFDWAKVPAGVRAASDRACTAGAAVQARSEWGTDDLSRWPRQFLVVHIAGATAANADTVALTLAGFRYNDTDQQWVWRSEPR